MYTDANGIATFQYLGEVTVVEAQMDEIKPYSYVAIPNAPDAYVQGQNNAIISAVIPSTLGTLFYGTIDILNSRAQNYQE